MRRLARRGRWVSRIPEYRDNLRLTLSRNLAEPESSRRAPSPIRTLDVRTGVQEYRRCAAQGGRLHDGAGLHRADLVAVVPQISGRHGRRPGDRGETRWQEIRLH